MLGRVFMQKHAVDTSVLRRAARKLVYNNRELRGRVKGYRPMPAPDPAEIDKLRKRVADLRQNPLDGLRAVDRHVYERALERSKQPYINPNDLKTMSEGKANMRSWVDKAKREAQEAGEPRAWRDYLPRSVDRMRNANIRVKRGKSAQRVDDLALKIAPRQTERALIEARNDLGRQMARGGVAHFDPRDGKIYMHGYEHTTPERRATTALHEFNEYLEAKRFERKHGVSATKATPTRHILGPGNNHMNATLPIRDLNIARTVTGRDAQGISEELENLRVNELDHMKQVFPGSSRMLSQLEGKGVVFGGNAPTRAVTRAQDILRSPQSSPALRNRAQKIVKSHEAATKPNVRLNRREINHIRDSYDDKFNWGVSEFYGDHDALL